MKIIQPHKRVAQGVISYKEIKDEATKLIELVTATNHPGFWSKALSIHHAQVSATPFNFFVVHPNAAKAFGGHQIICNAKILEALDERPFKEACMSYPHRGEIKTKRYYKVYATAHVPTKGISSLFRGLEVLTLELEGLAAIMLQHEIDHAKGQNIYEKFKR